MADELENKEEVVEVPAEAPESERSSKEEDTDYKALAEVNETLALAEKERADAAEALIVKNKKLAKRHGEEPEEAPLTESRLREILAETKSAEVDTEETKRLSEAQRKVKELQGKAAEMARAIKAKDSVRSDVATTHRDGEPGTAPKLPANSPLKSYKYIGNGVYSKKLANGKTMFVNTTASGNQPKKWVE